MLPFQGKWDIVGKATQGRLTDSPNLGLNDLIFFRIPYVDFRLHFSRGGS